MTSCYPCWLFDSCQCNGTLTKYFPSREDFFNFTVLSEHYGFKDLERTLRYYESIFDENSVRVWIGKVSESLHLIAKNSDAKSTFILSELDEKVEMLQRFIENFSQEGMDEKLKAGFKEILEPFLNAIAKLLNVHPPSPWDVDTQVPTGDSSSRAIVTSSRIPSWLKRNIEDLIRNITAGDASAIAVTAPTGGAAPGAAAAATEEKEEKPKEESDDGITSVTLSNRGANIFDGDQLLYYLVLPAETPAGFLSRTFTISFSGSEATINFLGGRLQQFPAALLQAPEVGAPVGLVSEVGAPAGGSAPELLAKATSENTKDWWTIQRKKAVPIGEIYQAKIPEFKSENSDRKWMGTLVWPYGQETTPTGSYPGKGRNDSCSCRLPGSRKCLNAHIIEEKEKRRAELSKTFDLWELEFAGEGFVRSSWSGAEMSAFKNIASGRPSSKSAFNYWRDLFYRFPAKGRVSLVRYYFDVFIMKQRAEQNHKGNGPRESDINSDDENAVLLTTFDHFGWDTRKRDTKGVSTKAKKEKDKLKGQKKPG